jgi:hypothetical protein
MPSGGRKGCDATSPAWAPVTLGRCVVRLPEGGRSCGRGAFAGIPPYRAEVRSPSASCPVADHRRPRPAAPGGKKR